MFDLFTSDHTPKEVKLKLEPPAITKNELFWSDQSLCQEVPFKVKAEPQNVGF